MGILLKIKKVEIIQEMHTRRGNKNELQQPYLLRQLRI